MKKAICVLFVFFMFLAVSAIAVAGQKPPKLECKKLALKVAKAYDERDIRALGELSGHDQEISDDEAEQLKQQLDAADELGELAPMLERMRNFPEIGDIPDWVTHVTIEYTYVDGERQIEFDSGFILNDGAWKVDQFAPDDRGDFESDKDWILKNSLPAPPEGKKTIDAGFNEFIRKVVTAIKEEDDETLSELTHLRVQEIQGEKVKYIQLMSQFPTIGPIPSPLLEFDMKLEGEDTAITVWFRCPENKLHIVKLEVL